MLESKFQADLIRDLKIIFPGCIVLKNDANYLQGFPDLLVLFNDRWAALEAKASQDAKKRPNQDYYIDKCDGMSFAAFIHPGNKKDILSELQFALRAPREARVSQR